MNEYDFQPEDVDQNPCIHPLPESLSNSRIFNSNCQSFIDHFYTNQRISQPSLQPLKSSHTPKQINTDIENQANFANQSRNSTFTHFLQKQKIYEKRTQDKISRLKQNLESKVVPETFHPQINKKSKYYAKKTNQNVFERLCKSNMRKQQDQNSTLFRPQISDKSKNIQRKEPIEQILYKDAKIRKQRYESLKENEKEDSKSYLNIKSQQFVGRRFLKEYAQLLQSMEINIRSSEVVSKELFFQILGSMGFVTSTILSHQQNLIDNAYEQFCRSQPTCLNLFVFLLVLIGVYHIDPFVLLDLKNNQPKPIYLRNQIQARSLHKKYNILYNNRLYLEEKPNESLYSSFSFKPAISPQSEALAQKHRKNLLAEASKLIKRPKNDAQFSESDIGEQKVKFQAITHPQFLILNKKMKELELQLKRQAQLKKIMEECTFQPKVSKFEITKRQRSVFHQEEGDQNEEKLCVGNSPMLILDIDFNGKQEQVVLRVEDESILANIAKYYSNKYFMDAESEAKLLELLSSELKNMIQ